MSDVKPDLRQIANEYRDRLTSELARIDKFIAMADRLAEPEESPDFDLMTGTGIEAPTVLH